AFASLSQKPTDALLVSPDPLFDSRRVQLITLAAHHRLPTIYPFRENVEIGGLMSYGSSAADRDRQVGIYTGRILKGEKPADLPVMRQPSSSWSSICRRQGRSASPYRRAFSPSRTRSSNEKARIYHSWW